MSTPTTMFLTPKQRAFCDEYLIDRNATAAALRAGYSESIALNGYLMAIPKIKQYLKERCADAGEKAQVNHDMILKELCKIAFGNLRNYFLPDGGLKPVHELSDDEAAALWSANITAPGKKGADAPAEAESVLKIRMYNKLTALDKIAKHLNFYAPEEKEPEQVYVYMDESQLCEHDHYGDDAFTKVRPPEIDLPIGDGNDVVCDTKGTLKFKLNLTETYDENIDRLERCEAYLKLPIDTAVTDAEPDTNHRGAPLFGEIFDRLKRFNANDGPSTNWGLCYKFMYLRRFEDRGSKVSSKRGVVSGEL